MTKENWIPAKTWEKLRRQKRMIRELQAKIDQLNRRHTQDQYALKSSGEYHQVTRDKLIAELQIVNALAPRHASTREWMESGEGQDIKGFAPRAIEPAMSQAIDELVAWRRRLNLRSDDLNEVARVLITRNERLEEMCIELLTNTGMSEDDAWTVVQPVNEPKIRDLEGKSWVGA